MFFANVTYALRVLTEGQIQLLKEIKMVDATVTDISNKVTALGVQVQTAVNMIASLQNQINTGAIDPADETALQQVDTQLATIMSTLSAALPPATPAPAPAPAPAAAKSA